MLHDAHELVRGKPCLRTSLSLDVNHGSGFRVSAHPHHLRRFRGLRGFPDVLPYALVTELRIRRTAPLRRVLHEPDVPPVRPPLRVVGVRDRVADAVPRVVVECVRGDELPCVLVLAILKGLARGGGGGLLGGLEIMKTILRQHLLLANVVRRVPVHRLPLFGTNGPPVLPECRGYDRVRRARLPRIPLLLPSYTKMRVEIKGRELTHTLL